MTSPPREQTTPAVFAAVLLALAAALLVLGAAVGSQGWSPPLPGHAADWAIVRDIRLPRSLGAWCAGALLGLAGAVAQGLFRNPLADPFLLGSASGAHLGVAIFLALLGAATPPVALATLGLNGAAFTGAALGVGLTLLLARGVAHTVRLLLAGVVVGMVLGALSSLVALAWPDILRNLQAFMLGTTGFIGWDGVRAMALALCVSLLAVWPLARVLDALSLGEDTARSLGLPLGAARLGLVLALALATGAAVAQAGLVAFVGLVAPHLVRAAVRPTHRWLLPLAMLAGGALLLAADIAGRWVIAPRQLPVGILTAVLGGGYLLYLLHRRPVE